MIPGWLNDTMNAFGRQIGLDRFELNDNGVAGLRFENSLVLKFEYAHEALMCSVGVGVPNDESTMKFLLESVHPSARLPMRVRAAYLPKSGEAFYAVRIPERSVMVTTLERTFRILWQLADRLRREVQ